MRTNSLTLCLLASALFTFGCTKSSNAPTAAQAPAVAPPAPPAAGCDGGKPPRLVTGQCGGNWKVTKDGSKTTCEFEWGPRVTCPAGSKSVGIEAVCYGVTFKPIPEGGKVKTAEDCVATFGKHPISPNYTLECCS